MKVVDSVSQADAELRALVRLRCVSILILFFSGTLIRTAANVVPLLDTRVYGNTREFVFPFLDEWEVRVWGGSVGLIRKSMKQLLTVRVSSVLCWLAHGFRVCTMFTALA